MKKILLLLACSVSLMQVGYSQIPYSIAGTVTDESGRPLPGTAIVINPGNLGTIADQEGRYIFSGLQPGRYVVLASYVGYERYFDTLVLEDNLKLDFGMVPARQTLQEVVIAGDYAVIRNRDESLNMEIVNDVYLRQNQGGSLMKSLDRLPGIDAMGIGSGQSKPVIRGLSFNRVVVVEKGIKHEGQQSGSDHGLEIDQYAIDQVEVIKGPSSLMYGSDAIGGVVDLQQSFLPERHSWGGSVDLSGNTNNALLGGSVKVHVRSDKLYVSLRSTYLDYGDFRVPTDSIDIYSYRAPLHNHLLRNTAGREGSVHLEAGWIQNGFSSRLFISRLESKNGFFANAHGLEPRRVDRELHDRSSRDIQYPYHQVNHWKAISRSAWNRENHTVEVQLGVQKNFRQEWSQYVNHGYMPATFPDTLPFPADLERQFEKYTYSGNIRFTYRTDWRSKIISGVQSEIQENRIDGRGFIIPAFDQSRLGAFLVMKQDIAENSTISGGLRYDRGAITTRAYSDWFPSPADPGFEPVPTDPGSGLSPTYLERAAGLERRFTNLTWTLGYNLHLAHLSVKANVGKGFRMPLAKELAANGVNYHHFSYEVGNPGLDPEISYQLDGGLEWQTETAAVGLSPFAGFFPNYIYLNPGIAHDRLYGNGNQVFTYAQSEVIRYGGEIHAHYQPLKYLRVGLIGEYVYALQLSGDKAGFGLPFSPPPSLLLNLRYTGDRIWKFQEPYVSFDLEMVASQQRIVPPEEPTPGYQVVHLGVGSTMQIREQRISIGLQLHNLFNQKYFDHTSYYRLVNVPEPGRSMVLNISIPFSNQLKSIKNK